MIPHYETMKTIYEKIASSNTPDTVKKECADVLSVLSMTMSENNDCLKYKLKGDTSTENMDAWGHEYVRHLAGEIVGEWNELTTETTDGPDEAMDDLDKKKELITLVKQIIHVLIPVCSGGSIIGGDHQVTSFHLQPQSLQSYLKRESRRA